MKTTQTYETNHQKLLLLMEQAGLTSLSQLSEVSGVSQWQLNRLLVGLILKMPLETLVNIAKALQVSLEQLLNEFAGQHTSSSSSSGHPGNPQELELLKREYQSLQDQLHQQKQTLEKEFQQSSLEVLESWLLQWPTAAVVAKKNPQLSAVKLLPLVKPITELLKQWNVETNTTVGEKVSYDPQVHQLLEGSGDVEPGDMVMVRYVGYCQGEKLLYRAKVSPVKQEGES